MFNILLLPFLDEFSRWSFDAESSQTIFSSNTAFFLTVNCIRPRHTISLRGISHKVHIAVMRSYMAYAVWQPLNSRTLPDVV